MINWKVRIKNPIFWVQVLGGVILYVETCFLKGDRYESF